MRYGACCFHPRHRKVRTTGLQRTGWNTGRCTLKTCPENAFPAHCSRSAIERTRALIKDRQHRHRPQARGHGKDQSLSAIRRQRLPAASRSSGNRCGQEQACREGGHDRDSPMTCVLDREIEPRRNGRPPANRGRPGRARPRRQARGVWRLCSSTGT